MSKIPRKKRRKKSYMKFGQNEFQNIFNFDKKKKNCKIQKKKEIPKNTKVKGYTILHWNLQGKLKTCILELKNEFKRLNPSVLHLNNPFNQKGDFYGECDNNNFPDIDDYVFANNDDRGQTVTYVHKDIQYQPIKINNPFKEIEPKHQINKAIDR